MDRIFNNKDFLQNLIKVRKRKFRDLVLKCSQENLKAVVECAFNVFNNKFKAEYRLKSSRNILQYFRKKILKERSVRTYIIRNRNKFRDIVKLVLKKILVKDHGTICPSDSQ
jgi:parvulin-like peptidyl-prolyl isomerase